MNTVLIISILLLQPAVEREWRQIHADAEETVSIDVLNMARLRGNGTNAATALVRVEYHRPPADDARLRMGFYDLYFNCDARTWNVRRWSHQDAAGQFYDTGWTFNRSRDATGVFEQTIGSAALDVACA